jgi:hypothetical protein
MPLGAYNAQPQSPTTIFSNRGIGCAPVAGAAGAAGAALVGPAAAESPEVEAGARDAAGAATASFGPRPPFGPADAGGASKISINQAKAMLSPSRGAPPGLWAMLPRALDHLAWKVDGLDDEGATTTTWPGAGGGSFVVLADEPSLVAGGGGGGGTVWRANQNAHTAPSGRQDPDRGRPAGVVLGGAATWNRVNHQPRMPSTVTPTWRP